MFSPLLYNVIVSHSHFFGAFLADSLSRLGRRPLLISATGADSHSEAVLNYCKHMVRAHQQLTSLWSLLIKYVNVKFFSSHFCQNTSGVARLEEQSTATYCAVITESGELSLGLGDMDIHQQITEQYVRITDTVIHFSKASPPFLLKLHIQNPVHYWKQRQVYL